MQNQLSYINHEVICTALLPAGAHPSTLHRALCTVHLYLAHTPAPCTGHCAPVAGAHPSTVHRALCTCSWCTPQHPALSNVHLYLVGCGETTGNGREMETGVELGTLHTFSFLTLVVLRNLVMAKVTGKCDQFPPDIIETPEDQYQCLRAHERTSFNLSMGQHVKA